MKSTNNLAFVLLLTVALAAGEIKNKGWWKNTVFYQIYPLSFKDSDDDGHGDLPGITSKLEHFNDINVGAIWLSPIYKSPMVDFGYDISDFREIASVFGTVDDLKKLIEKAHSLKLKVILDLVPNHTSDEHKWFELSASGTGDYKDYYIWRDAKMVNGMRSPPNNWVSVFNGSAWTWNEKRQQYFFHQFTPQQPDLNYSNLKVQNEMKEVMKFWMDHGVDGFRIDAVPHLFENNFDTDEALISPTADPDKHASYIHNLTKDQPQTYDLVKSWREYVDQYAKDKDIDEKVILTEAYTDWNNTIKYYNYGAHVPFNFKFIIDVNAKSNAAAFKEVVDKWTKMMPNGSIANWVMGNHDRVRVGTRYPNRGEELIMLEMLLPGVAVTYYGEEIGMVDNETLHYFDFRDGCRTPFQWDNSTNAGFSNGVPWLPVNNNYKTLNLANQKQLNNSSYNLYKSLTALRKTDLLRDGSLATSILQEDVLAIVRRKSDDALAFLMNFSESKNISVDITKLMPKTGGVAVMTSGNAGIAKYTDLDFSKVTVPARSAILLRSGASVTSCSLLMVVLLALASYFRS